VQVGASGVDTASFREFIEEGTADPLAQFFGGGDYTDSLSPSNRKLLNAAFIKGDLYDTPKKMLEAEGKRHATDFMKLVDGTKGRWNFLLKGHHLNEYTVPNANGSHTIRTTDQDIAEAVGAPYLGEPGTSIGAVLVSYRFPAPSRGRKRPVLRMYAVHGQSGGGSLAAPFSQLEKMSRAFTAHIYFTAHHHKGGAVPIVKLHEEVEASTSLRATDARLVAGGAWMKSYLPDEVTYAEDGLMVPLAIGAPIIRATARPNGTFKIRVEV
jgi:hypothetical protein